MMKRLVLFLALLSVAGLGVVEQVADAGLVSIVRPRRATQSSGSSGTLPSGVTLTATDGGNTYYADQGLTFATASFTVDGVTYSGLDDEDYYPTCLFLEKFNGTSAANKWDELNMNCALAVQGDVDLTLMNTRGVRLFIQSGEWLVNGGNNVFHATLNPNVVGIYLPDEPSTTAEAYNDLQNFPCSGTPVGNTGQTGRIMYTTFTHNNVRFYDVQGVPMNTLLTSVRTTPCSTRTLGIYGIDLYFNNGASAGPWPGNANAIYGRSGSMTDDLMKRGVRYADLSRFLRAGNANLGNAAFKSNTPIGIFVETGTSYNENTTQAFAIRSAQIDMAVWGSIIGGARFVEYFTLGDATSWNTDGLIGSAFWDTPYNGDSVSNYDQVAATNNQVRSLAAVVNSSTASGLVTSVSPSTQALTNTTMESGFEYLVKYYDRGALANTDFYIFMIPRYGDRTHNNSGVDTGAETWPKNATITLVSGCTATSATVVDESRTVTITNDVFTDSFASKTTKHIYRVDC